MGREIRRVPLDFYWPLHTTWRGFINPYRVMPCPHCAPRRIAPGGSPAAAFLICLWYGYLRDAAKEEIKAVRDRGETELAAFGEDILASGERWSYQLDEGDVAALMAANRLWDFTRVPLNEEQKKDCFPNGWTKEPNGRIPPPEEVNRWARSGFGHDGINQGVCVEGRCKRYGLDYLCEFCEGTADVLTDPNRKLRDEWEETPPPEGPGFQIWETTSEGSPITPVFATLDEACKWAAEHETILGDTKVSAEQWKQALDDGYHKEGRHLFF